jgi:hypothetical protein
LNATSIKFWLQLCEGTKFGGADWREVRRMAEKDTPFAVEELVEVDVAMCSLRLKIGC